jgi:hypothetical protein
MRRIALHPARALLHPAWLASLFVLALNDHLLKGSGLLPGVLTGKLSDVVGLVVAPLLLAALLGVRSFRAWVACHVAVGAVFAAIQLSAAAADGWSALMGLCGFPWVITRDPTDLLALPALAASLWGFLPVMRRSAAANARRAAETGVAAVGLLLCAATSDTADDCCTDFDTGGTDTVGTSTDDWGEDPSLPPISADVYLSNGTGQEVVVRIRALRPEVMLDCEAVAEAPGQLLRASLFAPAQSWMLPSGTNVAVLPHTEGQAPCYAAWVEADALSPAILFWYDGQPPIGSVPALNQSGLPGEVLLGLGELQGFELSSVSDLVSPADPRDPAGEDECAPQLDAERLGWSFPVPWGPAHIEAVSPGLDGCLAIELLQGDALPQTWYLCVPSSSFPFAPGDDVELRLPEDADPSLDALEIVALGDDGEVLPLPVLHASAGPGLPLFADIEMALVPQYACELASEATCGTVERPMALLVEGDDLEAAELVPGGEPLQHRDDLRSVEVTVMHAQERFVLDAACGQGSDLLGPDLEVVIAMWPT